MYNKSKIIDLNNIISDNKIKIENLSRRNTLLKLDTDKIIYEKEEPDIILKKCLENNKHSNDNTNEEVSLLNLKFNKQEEKVKKNILNIKFWKEKYDSILEENQKIKIELEIDETRFIKSIAFKNIMSQCSVLLDKKSENEKIIEELRNELSNSDIKINEE